VECLRIDEHNAVVRIGALGAVMVIVGASSWSGCSGDDEGRILHSGDSVVLVGTQSNHDSVAGVGFGGYVALVGPCLGLNSTTVVWPEGTKITSDEPLTIDVPGLGRLRIGDPVDAGAVMYEDGMPTSMPAVPSDCRTDTVAVLYPDR
jgi:hypothetical protein